MEGQLNYVGAIVFWLYILAALAFTSIVLKTLYDHEPSKASGRNDRGKEILLFSILAAISFITLSYNMLNVLVHSYTFWAHERNLNLADISLPLIWQWSITSTPFQDFGNAILQNSARYLWVEPSLIVTLCVCLYTAIEGQHRKIPHLWAYLALIQILPVSFAQNLFYIVLLQQQSARPEWQVPRKAIVGLSGAYTACLIVAPTMAGTERVIPIILLARAILVIVQIFPWKADEAKQATRKADDASLLDEKELKDQFFWLMALCGSTRATIAFLDTPSPAGIAKAIFEHPAVSALGCDFVISGISYACWRSVDASRRQDGAVAKRPQERSQQ